MDLKYIVIQYNRIDYDWADDLFTHYKILPYTNLNYHRVIKYVKALKEDNSNPAYDVYYLIINGDEINIERFFFNLNDGTMPRITVKFYNKDEMLPHEEDLAAGNAINYRKHFGQHSTNEDNIGSYLLMNELKL